MHPTDASRRTTPTPCPICGKEFEQRPDGRPKTCSKSCARKDEWRSGKRKPRPRLRHSGGYILAYAPDHPNAIGKGKYMMEHRLVMEKKLGRLLERHEHVHHKNGQRDDNRIENLELWNGKDPPGQRKSDMKRALRRGLEGVDELTVDSVMALVSKIFKL